MIAVFLGFVLDADRAIKLFGVGLAGAVFLDAFILRTVLVPVADAHVRRANWYFPRGSTASPRASPSVDQPTASPPVRRPARPA